MNAHKEYIRIVPGSDTAVLMIHGIIGTPRQFDFLLPTVPESMSLWNMLLDGHGGTTRDFSRSSMAKWLSQVDSAIDELSKTHSRLIIVGHSMGTLLALNTALRHPEKPSALFLLASPLKMKYTPTAIATSLHIVFGNPAKDSPKHISARHCCGIGLSKNPLHYLGWIPRYLELFALAREMRPQTGALKVPCKIYQSARDELVSMRSLKYLKDRENIELHILPKSMHYHYSEDEKIFLREELENIIKKVEVQ